MKYDGIVIPQDGNGSIDWDALFIEWLDQDAKGQNDRYEAWKKTLVETLATKGKYFPTIHEALLTFLKNPAYQQMWIRLSTARDMIYGTLLGTGKLPLEAPRGTNFKDLVAEYIESQCGDSTDPKQANALLFAEGKKKGKGVTVNFRLNPAWREALNAPADPPEDPAGNAGE